MEKIVKWQDKSPPPSESSESPTLSNHSRPTPQVKRKRSSIFSKLRKSFLNSISSGTNDNNNVKSLEHRGELKRALSMDAGLQNRISQLATTTPMAIDPIDEQELQLTHSKSRLRRSKSLINPVDLRPSNVNGLGSKLHSPIADESDSLMEECESLDAPQAASLIQTIENNHLHLSHQVFDCSWLAPTHKFQLFPGHLSLHPKTSTIIFHCQHLSRSIRLKFHLDDVLNISRGSWNDKRNQALIIDLIRGRRKSWVFVAWAEDQFDSALHGIVQAWRLHCLNKIKARTDRRNAHLNMKYCRMIKEADRAEIKLDEGILEIFANFFYNNGIQTINSPTIFKRLPTTSNQQSIELGTVLYAKEIAPVIPDALAAILMEQSTSFMANFRELQGIETLNDSGWHTQNGHHKNSQMRTFVSLVKDSAGMITFKWTEHQKLIFKSPELVIFQASLAQNSSEETENIVYEIASIRDEDIDAEPACFIKITTNIQSNRVREYLKDVYFPSLFHLLEAFIYEAACDFSGQEGSAPDYKMIPPPHYRFIKEFLKTALLEANLYFTTVFLPFLYKLVHFKEFKFARYSIASLILLICIRLGLLYLLNWLKISSTNSLPVNVEDQFGSFLKDLSKEAIDSATEIRGLKLKFNI